MDIFQLIIQENMEQFEIVNLISTVGRMIINFTSAFILIFCIYRTTKKRKSFLFSLFMFNLVIFIMGIMINSTDWTIGAGLGLFAIFTILRYRSETLQLKEMTYLFILIAVGFINAIGNNISWIELILLNASIVILSLCMERTCLSRVLQTKKIKYNDLNLIKPDKKEELAEDVYQRTGIKAKEIEVESVNFQDNTANLILYYVEEMVDTLRRNRKEGNSGSALAGKENREMKSINNNIRQLHYNVSEK
jgi:hypothetical protein